MSKRITFEALIAKREQREADKLKVGMLDIPGSDMALEARMPSQKVVLKSTGNCPQQPTPWMRWNAASMPSMPSVRSSRTASSRRSWEWRRTP